MKHLKIYIRKKKKSFINSFVWNEGTLDNYMLSKEEKAEKAEIFRNLDDMALEVEDEGYKVHYGGNGKIDMELIHMYMLQGL